MNLFKKEPHPLLLGRMLGPQVPSTFIDNGCSGVPDLYLKWPCRIHDYQYWQLRRAWGVIESIEASLKDPDVFGQTGIWKAVDWEDLVYESVETLRNIGVYQGESDDWNIKELIMAHHEYRELADKYFRANIKTLTRLKVVDGQIKKRSLWSRRLWGRGLNWMYYLGVRIGAARPAKHAEDADDANQR